MAFDLQRAFRKKQEAESARLDDFQFRHRARTMRLVVEALAGRTRTALDPLQWAKAVVLRDDRAILADLRDALAEPMLEADWHRMVSEATTMARAQLIAEFGDPSPIRLA